MDKRLLTALILFIGLPCLTFAKKGVTNAYYATGLCDKPGYKCIKVPRGTTWQKLFPNPRERDIVQRLNRSDTYLYAGKTIAVPNNLANITYFDISPFAKRIKAPGEKLIIVDQHKLAWAAYNPDGELQRWGPLSSGKDYCSDIKRSCKTITGIFYIFHKKDKKCESNVFPVGRGGAKMPYCMFFYKGYALHGSREVFGYRDSHGCVRIFTRDAKWLNEQFVEPATREGHPGTKIVVQKLIVEGKGKGKK